MPKGRPPLPQKTKVIQHTFRDDRVNKEAPEFEVLTSVPKPPMGLPRAGRRLWIRQAEELVRLGVLTDADLGAFEIICRQYGQAADLDHHITHSRDEATGKSRKRTVHEYVNERVQIRTVQGKDADGNPKEVVVMGTRVYERLAIMYAKLALERNALKGLAEFGLTPAARSRLRITPKDDGREVDPVERQMNAP